MLIARTTRPKPDESLLGYIRRLAALNAYIETTDFFADIGYHYGRPLIENIARFERMCGLPVGQLATITPAANTNKSSLDWQYDRRWSDPVCPKCLANGETYHHSWRHAFVTTCHKHELKLQDTCPQCFDALTPRSGGFKTCSCGLDLTRLPRQFAPPHEVTVSRMIAEASQFNNTGIPDSLRDKVPSSIGRFVHFLASSFIQNRTGKMGKTTMPKTISEAQLLLSPVAPLLANWPYGFEDHVRQRMASGNPGAKSAPERLGKWYQRLMQFKDPAYEPYRDSVARVIVQEFNGSYVGGLVSCEPKEWMTANEAATFLGVSAKRLVEAVKKQEIAGKQTYSGLGHCHTVIPRREVSTIAAEREQFWNGKQAREYLGAGRRHFDLLKESGLVIEVPTGERPTLTDGKIYSQSLRELVRAIRASVIEAPGDSLAFSELTLRRTTDRVALKKLLELICNGSIPACSAQPDAKLSDFRFLKSEVESVLRSERHSLDWSANDVAKLTGWKPETVTNWCKQGVIESRTVSHGPSVGYLISPAQLLFFQSRFVPVSTLAKAKGTSSRKLLSEFSKLGIKTHGATNEGATSRGHLVKLEDLVALAD